MIPAVHHKGNRARILFSSVFGPYAQNDEYGSRAINPMELYQNQVTRTQGSFSLRMFHRSFGLMMLQENIDAPCALLDFFSRERFVQEVQNYPYDIVGISAIMTNIAKVREMCALVRKHLSKATIVIGWQKYKSHPNKRIRKKFGMKVNVLRTTYAGAVWAMQKWYKGNDRMTVRMSELLQRLHEEFDWTTKLIAALSGRYIYTMLKREEKRLSHGWVYEHSSFYEKNEAAIALDNNPRRHPLPRLRERWIAGQIYPVRVSYPIMKGKDR